MEFHKRNAVEVRRATHAQNIEEFAKQTQSLAFYSAKVC